MAVRRRKSGTEAPSNTKETKMKAYGAKRTYGGCRTSRRNGGKIKVRVFVKNRKRGRRIAYQHPALLTGTETATPQRE